jgi:TRAP-type C4-dicarboxylate transport system substrate-binding protein
MRIDRCAGVLATAAILAGCGTAGQHAGGGDTRAEQNRLVLTIATGEGTPVEATVFAAAVAGVSEGSIEIKVNNTSVPGHGVPAYETDVINHVADGKAQLGFVAARAFDTVGVRSFVGLHAPFLIDSYELEEQVLTSDWGQALLDGTRSAGLIGIGYVQGPLRRPLGQTRPLTDLAAHQGARIGIRAGDVAEMTMEALGATPVVFPPGDSSGLDGMEAHVEIIAGAKYDFGADSLTGNVVYWPRPGVIFANAVAFEAMTSDQQALLREAAEEAFKASATHVPASDARLVDELCARGLEITTAPDGAISDLRTAVQSVYDEIEMDASTRATINAIEALRASADAPLDAVECDVAAATPSAASTILDSPIVGTFTTSYTKDDLAASPYLYDAGEVNDENWGELTITLEPNGRVGYTQTNAIESSSASGRYSVEGDHIVMAFDAGDSRGDTFSGRWSLFRDTLVFKRVPGELLPTWFLLRAWTRVQ